MQRCAVLVAFFRRDLRIAWSYKFYSVMLAFATTFFLLILFFIGRMLQGASLPALTGYGNNYFAYVAVGLAQSTYFSLALTALSGAIREAQYTGVLEALLVTQQPPLKLMFYSALFPFVASTLQIVLIGFIGIFGFGLETGVANLAATVVVLVVSLLAYLPWGLLSAAFVVKFKLGNPIPTLLAGSSYLLSGIYFPVEVLPPWLQMLARALPTTYAVEALRLAFLRGATIVDLYPQLLFLGLNALVFGVVGSWVLLWAIKQSRRDGTLSTY